MNAFYADLYFDACHYGYLLSIADACPDMPRRATLFSLMPLFLPATDAVFSLFPPF